MQKRTREIAALVLLVLLAAGVVAAMAWYVLVGHGWNVAASNIDDRIGSMSGYKVIVYEGTLATGSASGAASPASPSSAASSGAASSTDSSSAAFSASASSGDPSGASASSSSAAPSSASTRAGARGPSRDNAVTLADATASYLEKDATVFVLRPKDLGYYAEPFVVQKNGTRVGFVSVAKPARLAQLRTAVRKLQLQGADFIVLLTDDRAVVDMEVAGVDVMVCTGKSALPDGGSYSAGKFCVGQAPVGSVQAILVAPSGVISSKVVSEL